MEGDVYCKVLRENQTNTSHGRVKCKAHGGERKKESGGEKRTDLLFTLENVLSPPDEGPASFRWLVVFG